MSGPGCPSDDPAITGTISGSVKMGATPVADVTLVLDAGTAVTTGADGTYAFTGVPLGTHTVRISTTPPVVECDTSERSVTVSSTSRAATVDFHCAPVPTDLVIELQRTLLRGSLYVKDSVGLGARGLAFTGDTIPVHGVSWSSSSPEVATISEWGFLRGHSFGQVQVTATLGDVSSSMTVDVAGTLHTEPISDSQLWDLESSPHVLASYLSVGGADTVTLTVAGGASVFSRDGGGLHVGEAGYARLIADGSDLPIVFEHERPDAEPGTWRGLHFVGPTTSVLAHTLIRLCGGYDNGHSPTCVKARSWGGSTTLVLEDVTVADALGPGVILERGTHFGEGSSMLSVDGVEGPVVRFPASELPRFPYGGTYSNLSSPAIEMQGDTLAEDVVWRDAGVPWFLSGNLVVRGPDGPTLTMSPGLHVRSFNDIIVGLGQPGRLQMGDINGPPVTLESAIALRFEEHALPSSMENVDIDGCGSDAYDPCLSGIGDGAGLAPSVLVRDVLIDGAQWHGVHFTRGAHFAAGSEDLTISGSRMEPMALGTNAVGTIPPGSYTGNTNDRILVLDEPMTGDHRWADHGIPYLVRDDLALEDESDPTLALDPGVRIQFAPGVGLHVGRAAAGGIEAVGTAEDPVVFTSELWPPFAGAWKGVNVEDLANDRTLFEHVVIEFAGARDGLSLGGAVRFTTDLGPILRSSLVRHSATCGILRAAGVAWTTDFTDPALSNTFEFISDENQCGP